MSHNLNILLNKITNLENIFVTPNLKKIINNTVRNFFPQLNQQDIEILQGLTVYIVDLISNKLSFEKENNDYYEQWTQNNYRDIKGVILLLLPFIDDKNDSQLLKKITDLNQLIYSKNERSINKKILNEERNNNFLSNHFEFGNMGIGLLNSRNENLLDLFPNNNKLIYDIIDHNFVGLIKTLEIINGKFYINWVNIVPLNTENYNESKIYKATQTLISNNTNNLFAFEREMMLNYSGIWVGNIYNILRINYFENAKKIKWLFFPYETNERSNKFYLIQVLNKVLDLDSIINSNCTNYNDLTEDDQINFRNNFKNLVINISLNNPIITNSLDLDFEIIKYMLIFMVNNYSEKYNLPFNKKFELNNEKEDNYNNEKDKILLAYLISYFKHINENGIINLHNIQLQ